MDREADTIETVEVLSKKEVLNQDGIKKETKKSSVSFKEVKDSIPISENGNAATSDRIIDDKSGFCDIDLEEVTTRHYEYLSYMNNRTIIIYLKNINKSNVLLNI